MLRGFTGQYGNKDFSTRIKPRWTLQQECFKLFGCFCSFCLAAAVQGKKAEPLLKFNNESETFEFNQEVLNEVSKLPSRIRVITFLGDAKVGRSTALNALVICFPGGGGGFEDAPQNFILVH